VNPGAERDRMNLSNGVTILCNTLVWIGGISPDHLVRKLECDHDKAGRIIANNHLEILGFKDAFAIGDCASIKDPRTGNPYPPTAQHALRQARVVANNLISLINGRSAAGVEKVFDYKTKGMMALIGKRNGVGILFGHKVHGFTAWWLWRSYYLGNLPTVEKKLRVIVDWFIDLFFKRDVTRLKTLTVKRSIEDRAIQTKQTEA
jgi:NADH:ubiquinone reductase (H+-translocating)